MPFAAEGINKLIEESILRADRIGVKVISLAALNKVSRLFPLTFLRWNSLASEIYICMYISFQNEALNGGGTLFVDKHPNLRVRVVHGNTLTAAVILNEIPQDVTEVFLTGATSKLGRAIALYLARKKVRIMVRPQKPANLFYFFNHSNLYFLTWMITNNCRCLLSRQKDSLKSKRKHLRTVKNI